jgi:RNA polymerase sigma factor (sigma-70 family)
MTKQQEDGYKKCPQCRTVLTLLAFRKEKGRLRDICGACSDDGSGERNTHQSYSGEKSPYWEWVSTQMGAGRQIEADPREDQSPFAREELSREQRIRIMAIQSTWEHLTAEQRQVVWLIGVQELSFAQAAEKLGKTKAAIQGLLDRARKQIQKTLENQTVDEDI